MTFVGSEKFRKQIMSENSEITPHFALNEAINISFKEMNQREKGC